MKTTSGILLMIALVIGLIYGSIKAIEYTQGPNPAAIGPHETAYVSIGDYLTLPKANITATSHGFFILENQDTKDVIYSVFVPPSVGEENPHFVITNPPEGVYRVTRASIALFSETPASITTQESKFDRTINTGAIVIFAIVIFIVGLYIFINNFI